MLPQIKHRRAKLTQPRICKRHLGRGPLLARRDTPDALPTRYSNNADLPTPDSPQDVLIMGIAGGELAGKLDGNNLVGLLQ